MVVVVVVVGAEDLLGAVVADGVLSSFTLSYGKSKISTGSMAMFAIVLHRPTKKVAGPIACAGVAVTVIEKVTRAKEQKLRTADRCIF